MTTTSTVQPSGQLAAYRDDGPLAMLALGAGADRKLSWLGPPLVRAVEYGGLIALTLAAAPEALPACFALLSALAFHHYDTVYRLRHQRAGPPRWIGHLGGGWEVRLLVAGVLAAVGWLPVAMVVAAVVLGATYVIESVTSWRRFSQLASVYESEEDEQE